MVVVKKAWSGTSDQSVSDDKGNTWAVTELIEQAKDLPVMEIPLDHLSINKNIAGVTIRTFVAHMKNVLDADLDCPIILDEDGCVFDGRHRLARALFEGKETIKAVRFVEDPAPTYVKPND